MKALFKSLILVGFSAILIVGCGKDGGNNSAAPTCDQYGRCTGAGYYNYGPYGPVNPNFGLNPNAVILSGQVGILGSADWKQTQEGLGNCGKAKIFNWTVFDSCKWSILTGGNPLLTITIDDYKLSGSGKTSSGTVTMSSRPGPYGEPGIPPQMWQVRWRAINNDTAFGTEILAPVKNGRFIILQIVGRTTDRYVQVNMLYDNQTTSAGANLMGTGTLYRVNLPPQ